MKEWRFVECSEGCGLANRQFFEVPETGKLKSLQKIRGGERFFDSAGSRGNTRLKMSRAVLTVVFNEFINVFIIIMPRSRW